MKETKNTLNLSELPILNEETVLHVLQNNYANGLFYVWGGRTLLAINPCTVFQHLYTQKTIELYHKSKCQSIQEPHVYAVAENAHHMLASDLGKINQAIIVSGESGAGKTYTTSEVLKYLTSVAMTSNFSTIKDHQPQRVQQKIVDSTPLLEAFGNASTAKNKNSSRFGKFIQLQYNKGEFTGAKISTYLLEKTRVTTIPRLERSYNVFYQMIAGISENDCKNLMLTQELITSLSEEVTDQDKIKFQATKDAMNDIGLCTNTQNDIFQVLSALLHLRNLSFKLNPGDDCIAISESAKKTHNIEAASTLLGLSSSTLEKILIVKTITAGKTIRRSVYTKPCCTIKECEARRDCLVRFIYDSLFDWLVKFINQEVASPVWDYFIGILDVYGFENFNYNSLEQLCINFANEKLQQYFVKDFLHDEQAVFIEEGIDYKLINYTDNKQCLELLEERNKASVFGLLNENCQLAWSIDEISLTKKILDSFKNNKYIEAPKDGKGKPLINPNSFIIKHFAGNVEYSTEGMIEKNKDNIPEEFKSLLAGSLKAFVKLLSPTINNSVQDKKTRKQTVLSKFKASLDDLVKKLNLCDGHYIRCLVPNSGYQPGYLNSQYLLMQLRACGILESIAIFQRGLPVRIRYDTFITHYHPLFGKSVKYLKRLSKYICQNNEESNKLPLRKQNGGMLPVLQTTCRQMISDSLKKTLSQQDCQFGRLKIFLSSEVFHELERSLLEKHSDAASIIQFIWKNYQKRRNNAAVIIQTAFRKWKNHSHYIKMRMAAIKIQRAFRQYMTLQNDNFTTVRLISKDLSSFQSDGDKFYSISDFSRNNSVCLGDDFSENKTALTGNELRNISHNSDVFDVSNDDNFIDEFKPNHLSQININSNCETNQYISNKNEVNTFPEECTFGDDFNARNNNSNNCRETFRKNNFVNFFPFYFKQKKGHESDKRELHCEFNETVPMPVCELRKIYQTKSEFVEYKNFNKDKFRESHNINLEAVDDSESQIHNKNDRKVVSKSVPLFTAIQHLYLKYGLLSVRRMPKTKIRFHTRLTPLLYSHYPPLCEIQCSLTDALEDETDCIIHRLKTN
ncbi:unconventional myosin-XIX-like [Centruroides vittatus]|uniref:unconventional myosin-XIX-like n=1 Tax=Centruroides vittatus TaxID=120091 RepID=UPI00350E96E0